MSSDGSVTRVPDVADQNLVICVLSAPNPANPELSELCAIAEPGPAGTVAATLLLTSETELSVYSDGAFSRAEPLSYGMYLDACVEASRRECEPARITVAECIAASVDLDDCSLERADEIGAAFACEASCGEDCSDPCGVLQRLVG
ncbi:MAG: hypothetical protein IT382_04660 [Deltaproteobacteria bacterium]|nr:hypothetical protein [Deltaproteobacteria bacterium]